MLLVLKLVAISPLAETSRAMLLASPNPSTVNLPWVRWARAELGRRPLRLPPVWPLVVNGLPVYPEFLVPARAVRAPEFDDELARLRLVRMISAATAAISAPAAAVHTHATVTARSFDRDNR